MIRAIKSLAPVGRLHAARRLVIPASPNMMPAAATATASRSEGMGRHSSANGVVGLAAITLGLALSTNENGKAVAKCEKVELINHPIGTRGQPWGDAEKKQWLETRKKSPDRSYDAAVMGSVTDMARVPSFKKAFRPVIYGELSPEGTEETFPLLAFVSNGLRPGGAPRGAKMEESRSKPKPTILVTGGTHGYETSGIEGALRFLSSGRAEHYSRFFDVVVVPCVSPWSYEHDERWVSTADDPNRSFGRSEKSNESANHNRTAPMRTEESRLLLEFLDGLTTANGSDDATNNENDNEGDDTSNSSNNLPKWLCHIDLHETTDSDVREFRPSRAARDGLSEYDNHIPDGFYLVGDSCDTAGKKIIKDDDGNHSEDHHHLDFYNAILKRVEGVTHIAESDEDGTLIGFPAASRGLILVPCKELGLCGGGAVRDAPYVVTTEVYPDSDKTTEEDCINAQVEAICGALDYLLKKECP